MEFKNLLAVGKIHKTHGVRGLLKIQFDNPLSHFKGLPFTSIFIDKSPNPLPYFLASFEELNDGQCLIGLEEIDGREKAMAFTGKELFLPQDIAEKVFDLEDEGEYTGLEGFTLFDQLNNEIGKIEEVLLMPGQELAQVIYNNQEVLIPINEHQVISINEELLTVQVNIPEGLLDLND